MEEKGKKTRLKGDKDKDKDKRGRTREGGKRQGREGGRTREGNPYNRGGLQRERDEAGRGKQYEGGCGKQDKDKGNEKDKRRRTSSRKGRKGQWMTRKVE